VGVSKVILVGQFLDELRRSWQLASILWELASLGLISYIEMSTEKAGQEKRQVGDKLLVSAITLSICLFQVHRQGNDV